MVAPSPPPLLEIRQVTKRFPGVLALDRVDLTLEPGEVLAVIGENGAGKSTLMNLLAGLYSPDAGEIQMQGHRVDISTVPTALGLGIALIHQELNLCDNLDVAANIFLGREPHRLGVTSTRRVHHDALQFLRMVGLDISPRTIVSTLPIGHQQLVEIAKALSVQARILIMDEPTSSLSQRETETLLEVVQALRERGVSIVYISHRLAEVRQIADRVVVLRDGRNAGELGRAELDHDRMVQLMVGRDVSQFYSRLPHQAGKPLLDVRDLVVPAHPQHRLSFSVRRGEIVGLAGLVGAGRSELLSVLFGAERSLGGRISIAGQPVRFSSTADAIRTGVVLVPEDRKNQGLILEMGLRENIGLPGLWRHRRAAGWLNRRQEAKDAAEMTDKLQIRASSADQVVQFLSGGNQQKVVLGKWLALRPRVLLLDEPTRGIDVGAKHEIYRLMDELAASGIAVLFASSEMEEILGMSDRVLVMHEGRLTGELGRSELQEESIMQLATGGKQDEP